METFIVITSVVVLIVSIVALVKFFLLCSDVLNIRLKIEEEIKAKDAFSAPYIFKLSLMGEADKAYNKICARVFDSMYSIYANADEYNTFVPIEKRIAEADTKAQNAAILCSHIGKSLPAELTNYESFAAAFSAFSKKP